MIKIIIIEIGNTKIYFFFVVTRKVESSDLFPPVLLIYHFLVVWLEIAKQCQ
jgi:hypothetical protein